jgi:hypothetical protein
LFSELQTSNDESFAKKTIKVGLFKNAQMQVERGYAQADEIFL